MSDELKKIMEGVEDPKENSFSTMFSDFYNRKMTPIVVFTWAWSIIIIVIAVWSAVRFSDSQKIKDQIMFAAIFICAVSWINLMKIWAWQMIHRNSIKRDIRRLQRCVAELAQIVERK